MRLLSFALTMLTVTSFNNSFGADRAASLPLGPVHAVTSEPGVVPSGTSLVIRTNDSVATRKAYRGTVYDASIADDVLDQNGSVLIPKESPVELVVRSLTYLGPGGVGMTELTLAMRSVTVNGVRYPVETRTDRPGAGGIGVDPSPARPVGNETAERLVTQGRRIDVPVETMLAFQTEDPIRLRGYLR